MATIKDVAKRASVSTATVSAVLNGTTYVSPELRQRVQQAVAELGYTTDGVARSLKKGMTNLIGLIVDDVTAPFYMSLVDEISAAAYAEGYSVLLCPTEHDAAKEKKYMSVLRSHRVAGIIWAPTGRPDNYAADDFKNLSIPIVFVDRVVPTVDHYDTVLLDNRLASMQATNYLLDLGHRRIAMITGSDFVAPSRERREGYEAAFSNRDLIVDPDLIRNGQFRAAEAFAECRQLLRDEKSVSAILIGSDQMFIGVMRALQHQGLSCPRDISIATIDDFPLAGVFSPRITAVRQPIREMGQTALKLLLQRISGGERQDRHSHHDIFEPTLIVRDSCAPVAADVRVVPPDGSKRAAGRHKHSQS